jgi:hypothetical protein
MRPWLLNIQNNIVTMSLVDKFFLEFQIISFNITSIDTSYTLERLQFVRSVEAITVVHCITVEGLF